MKKYVIRLFRSEVETKIQTVDVERETDSSVWINGRRANKRSDYYNYYDSWEDAHAKLYEVQALRCSSLRRQLQRANSILGNIKGMKKPTKTTNDNFLVNKQDELW